MTAEPRVIREEHLAAAVDAVIGLDASQTPTGPEQLQERLTFPQPSITQALTLLFSQEKSKQVQRAAPLVYVALEAAARAFPEEMKSEIKSKQFLTALAGATAEAKSAAKGSGVVDGTTKARQPVLAAWVEQQLGAEGSYTRKLSFDDRAGVYALALGAVRAVDRHLLGPEQPVHIAKEPGRNDPCFCGSGRKFKKCHELVDRAQWPVRASE
jgi:hypothetical protein